jgi:hypothetical protein
LHAENKFLGIFFSLAIAVPDLGCGNMRFLQCQMRIACRTVALVIGLGLFSTVVTRAIAIDNVVLQWNESN